MSAKLADFGFLSMKMFPSWLRKSKAPFGYFTRFLSDYFEPTWGHIDGNSGLYDFQMDIPSTLTLWLWPIASA
jgi:hypothetical protein